MAFERNRRCSRRLALHLPVGRYDRRREAPRPRGWRTRRRRRRRATPNRPGRGGDGVASLLLLASVHGEFAEETSALRVEHVEVDGRGRVVDAAFRRGAPNLVAQTLETRLKRRNLSRSRRVRVRGRGGRARGRRPVGRAATTTASRSTGVDRGPPPASTIRETKYGNASSRTTSLATESNKRARRAWNPRRLRVSRRARPPRSYSARTRARGDVVWTERSSPRRMGAKARPPRRRWCASFQSPAVPARGRRTRRRDSSRSRRLKPPRVAARSDDVACFHPGPRRRRRRRRRYSSRRKSSRQGDVATRINSRRRATRQSRGATSRDSRRATRPRPRPVARGRVTSRRVGAVHPRRSADRRRSP